jgi:hypothetical protein
LLLRIIRFIYAFNCFDFYWCYLQLFYSLTYVACLIGEPYLFLRARARFVCAYALTIAFLMTWRGSPNAFGGGRCPLFTKRIALQTRLRHSRNLAVLLPRATVVAHEKHRPSGVRTRRRQLPLIAMYSKFCPAERASPPLGGASSRGVF